MYRPSTNWNGHRPGRRTSAAHRALAATAGDTHGTARRGPLPGLSTLPLPSWLPDCDE